jgi:hypothetical protein
MNIRMDYLGRSRDELELTTRIYNCFVRERINSVAELIQLRKKDLLSWRNFGKKSLAEVIKLLDSYGLELGMSLPLVPTLDEELELTLRTLDYSEGACRPNDKDGFGPASRDTESQNPAGRGSHFGIGSKDDFDDACM